MGRSSVGGVEMVESEEGEDITVFLFCMRGLENGCFGPRVADCEVALLRICGFSTLADCCVGVTSLPKSCTGSTLCELARSSVSDIG